MMHDATFSIPMEHIIDIREFVITISLLTPLSHVAHYSVSSLTLPRLRQVRLQYLLPSRGGRGGTLDPSWLSNSPRSTAPPPFMLDSCVFYTTMIFTWCEYHSHYYQTLVFGGLVWPVRYVTSQPVSPRMMVKLYCCVLTSSMSVTGVSVRPSLMLSWAHHAPVWEVP